MAPFGKNSTHVFFRPVATSGDSVVLLRSSCTEKLADTSALGTAEPETNGCISNCGTEIVNNDSLTRNLPEDRLLRGLEPLNVLV